MLSMGLSSSPSTCVLNARVAFINPRKLQGNAMPLQKLSTPLCQPASLLIAVEQLALLLSVHTCTDSSSDTLEAGVSDWLKAKSLGQWTAMSGGTGVLVGGEHDHA